LPAVSNVEKIIEENKRIIREDLLRRLEQSQQYIPQVAHLLPYNPNPTPLEVLEQQHKFLLMQQQLMAHQYLSPQPPASHGLPPSWPVVPSIFNLPTPSPQ